MHFLNEKGGRVQVSTRHSFEMKKGAEERPFPEFCDALFGKKE